MQSRISCVYKITNIISNKIYIGQTINYKHRIYGHRCALKHSRHSNPKLQEDYDKYGLDIFNFEILERCSKDDLLERETFWINYYGGIESDDLYNRCDLSGHNLEYINKQADAQLGVHKISDAGKLRISQANKGKIITEEQKQKIRQAAKRNPNYGMRNKKHSQQSKELMSKKKKGKYLGSANSNYKYTPEFIAQLRDEYNEIHNYNELSRKYKINATTISRLIRFGKC